MQSQNRWSPACLSNSEILGDATNINIFGMYVNHRARKLSDAFDEKYFHNNPEFVLKIITNMFGNHKSLIYHIINTITEEKQNELCEIFNTEQLENDCNINDENQAKISYFDRLPLSSITNICGYFTKKDIKRLKRTCSMTAIQCCAEMKKYSIGLFVYNDFIVNYKYKYLSITCTLYSCQQFKYDRYPKSLMCNKSLLIVVWCNKYKIKQKHMLLAINNGMGSCYRFEYPLLPSFGVSNDLFMLLILTSFMGQYNALEIKRVIVMNITDLIFIGFDGQILSEKLIDEITNSETLLQLYAIKPIYYFNIKRQYDQFSRLLIMPKQLESLDAMILQCIQNSSDENTNEFMNMYNNVKSQKQSMRIDVINGVYLLGLYDQLYLHQLQTFHANVLGQIFYISSEQCANQTHIVERLKL